MPSFDTNTFGSDFDTMLTIYTAGPAPIEGPAGLSAVACQDDAPNTRQSSITFKAMAGTEYYIQAGGWRFDAGALKLSLNKAA